ncbi:uncharacterized protein EI97DRAFT_472570 [Westerdykella ornata]|uniref:Cytochrome P450 n=1 Tax=Westerdykella ornata TaxID=318751 RepID=A0A6A6JX91_WESOR|nr:uncharacterized protein EI97DRAFT_472570 [Westerdykella ornata]KAF2281240.1 hypothetical protein EI97DRAFT_472570 [Westerdykella ornata]
MPDPTHINTTTPPPPPPTVTFPTIPSPLLTSTKAFVKTQRNIIECFQPSTITETKPVSRALANQRLVRVFGIDNVFTNADDPVYRKRFTQQSTRKMRVAIGLSAESEVKKKGKDNSNDSTNAHAHLPETEAENENWEDLRAAARTTVNEFLTRSSSSSSTGAEAAVNVVDFAQYVTLKVSLKYLFPDASPSAPGSPSAEFAYIQFIGQRINELWLASKNPHDTTTSWKDETRLHEALLAVTAPRATWMRRIARALEYIPGLGSLFRYLFGVRKEDAEPHPLDPTRNPMNWLLPAYETMWRVVMRCVLEVGYRGAGDADVWKRVIAEYVSGDAEFRRRKKKKKNESDGGYDGAGDVDLTQDLRAMDITREILRLYPPVTHIHRRVNKTSPEILKADILACHRNPLLSHNDPDVFRPERWIQIERDIEDYLSRTDPTKSRKREEQERGFLPFAAVCPSDRGETRGFGMKMIALLTGVMLEGLGGGWQLDKQLPEIGTALEGGRTSYLDLHLKRLGDGDGEQEERGV